MWVAFFLLLLVLVLMGRSANRETRDELRSLQRQVDKQKDMIDKLRRELSGQTAPTSPPITVAAAAPLPPPFPLTNNWEAAASSTVVDVGDVLQKESFNTKVSSASHVQAASEEVAAAAEQAVIADEESTTFEELLGGRIFIWIGAIALSLAGIFLVKYSFDHGWISPPVRVGFAVLLGLVFLAAGEWMRNRSARIAQGLSAAGIAVLYAAFLGAYHLYHLISGTVALGLLAITTLAAVLLSSRQGPFVVLLGLIGGFLTPSWIRSTQPEAAGLFTYLALLQIALAYVTFQNSWWLMAGLSMFAGFIWVFSWAVGFFHSGDAAVLQPFVLGSTALYLIAGMRYQNAPRILRWATAVVGTLLTVLLIGIANYAVFDWLFLAILCLGFLLLTIKDPSYFSVNCYAAVLAGALLFVWSFSATDPVPFLSIVLLFGALHGAAGYLLIWKTAERFRWALFCSATVAGFFLIGYNADFQSAFQVPWTAVAVLLSALFVAGSLPVFTKVASAEWPSSVFGVLVGAAAFFACLAVPLALHQQWLTIGWALQTPLLVWIGTKMRVQILLRFAVILLAIVSLRLITAMGVEPSWSSILLNYAVPLVAIGIAGWLADRSDEKNFAKIAVGFCLVFTFIFLTLAVYRFQNPATIWSFRLDFRESALLSILWFSYALGLFRYVDRYPNPFIQDLPKILSILTFAFVIYSLLIVNNPLVSHQSVGAWPVLNWLLLAYGLPALLMVMLANRWKHPWFPIVLRTVATVFLVMLIYLEVRHAFHGEYLDNVQPSIFENYCYSAAWILLGCGMLVVGVIRKNRELRYSSLGVMSVSVFKVFLYDSSYLKDLFRVFTFLGLGISLLVLAYIYQRFVFRKA
jgi:uncharacterized membrane protein